MKTAAAFDTTKLQPYAVYQLNGRIFVLAELAELGAPSGSPEIVDQGHNIDAILQKHAGGASGSITLVGPDQTCVGKIANAATVALKDRSSGASVVEPTSSLEVTGCGAMPTPTLAFAGELPEARWEWPTPKPDVVVPTPEIRMHAAEAGGMGRNLNRSMVYQGPGQFEVVAADQFDLPEQTRFSQDLCEAVSGALAWIRRGKDEVVELPRPLTIGTVFVKDHIYLVADEDYGEVVRAWRVSGSATTLALDGVLPAAYDLDCEAPPPETGPPLKATPLAGPYADLDAYCAELSGNRGGKQKCTSGEFGAKPLATTAPYLAIEPIQSKDQFGGFFALGIATEGGLYVLEDVAPSSGSGSVKNTVEIGEMKLEDVAKGGAPELIVRFTAAESFTEEDASTGDEVDDTIRVTDVLVCGVGASNVPSCLRVPLEFQHSRTMTKGGGIVSFAETKLDLKFENNLLILAGKATNLTAETMRRVETMLGDHPMVFP